MILELSLEEIKKLLVHQLSNLFLPPPENEKMLIEKVFGRTIERLNFNFSQNPNKYYYRETEKGKESYFNPFHSGQWTIFLYYLSYELGHLQEDKHCAMILADKVYYLNKMMNSCDLYHQVELPDYFRLDHPQGSVIGRAVYGNGFTFLQCCTVGNNKGLYPVIGDNVKMCMNYAILGNSHIGNNVIVGAGALIKDQNIPDNCIVFGQSPNLIIKSKK